MGLCLAPQTGMHWAQGKEQTCTRPSWSVSHIQHDLSYATLREECATHEQWPNSLLELKAGLPITFQTSATPSSSSLPSPWCRSTVSWDLPPKPLYLVSVLRLLALILALWHWWQPQEASQLCVLCRILHWRTPPHTCTFTSPPFSLYIFFGNFWSE
jgi:hypothetical protein